MTVAELLERGHAVTAYARNPAKVPEAWTVLTGTGPTGRMLAVPPTSGVSAIEVARDPGEEDSRIRRFSEVTARC